MKSCEQVGSQLTVSYPLSSESVFIGPLLRLTVTRGGGLRANHQPRVAKGQELDTSTWSS